MLLWLLLAQVLSVRGMPRLLPPPPPPLPMEDGCLVASPEVPLFRVEGDAVILSFPFLHSDLRERRMSLTGATVLISKTNETNGTYSPAPETGGRVLQRGGQLWLLPALESDSGQYTCTYRTETLCVRGDLTLQVYSSRSVDMDKLSFGINLFEGQPLSFRCPSLGVFNRTETHIHWDKVSGPGEQFDSGGGRLQIPAVRRGHRGLYRCKARVQLDHRPFTVSRAVFITVRANPLAPPTDLSVTSEPELTSTQIATEAAPPVIISPLNGSVFENSQGSGLELVCTVLTDCPMAESTLVTWLVDGQSVEASYVDGRALQGAKRVSWGPEGCLSEVRLMILEMTERDTEAELKCVTENQHGRQEVSVRLKPEDSTHTWLVVSVAVLCLLSVVFILLCVLVRPKLRRTKVDYILARQNSTF